MDTYCPGGIHLPNLPQLLHASIAPISNHSLDGVAVISDIVSSNAPRKAAQALSKVVASFRAARVAKGDTKALFAPGPSVKEWSERTPEALIAGVQRLLGVVRQETPMIHQVRSADIARS